MVKWLIAAVAVAIVLPLAVVLLVAAGPAASQATSDTAGGPSVVALGDIPPSYLALYVGAARTCAGLPWGVLAGIGKVESDHGRSTAPGVHAGANFAGAEGPMQFEPATFAQYAASGGHGGRLSPYDPVDAVYTAAAMLCANGAAAGTPAGIRRAVFAYNHSWAYARQVLAWQPTTPLQRRRGLRSRRSRSRCSRPASRTSGVRLGQMPSIVRGWCSPLTRRRGCASRGPRSADGRTAPSSR